MVWKQGALPHGSNFLVASLHREQFFIVFMKTSDCEGCDQWVHIHIHSSNPLFAHAHHESCKHQLHQIGTVPAHNTSCCVLWTSRLWNYQDCWGDHNLWECLQGNLQKVSGFQLLSYTSQLGCLNTPLTMIACMYCPRLWLISWQVQGIFIQRYKRSQLFRKQTSHYISPSGRTVPTHHSSISHPAEIETIWRMRSPVTSMDLHFSQSLWVLVLGHCWSKQIYVHSLP